MVLALSAIPHKAAFRNCQLQNAASSQHTELVQRTGVEGVLSVESFLVVPLHLVYWERWYNKYEQPLVSRLSLPIT